MILWVLTASVDYEDRWVVGIFTSEEKALKVMYEQINKKWPADGYTISPTEVDTILDMEHHGEYYRTHKIRGSSGSAKK